MLKDYSGQNLRGRSFKGQNLAGANFSNADIRSADFTRAILKGTNFSHAKAGLQKLRLIFLVLVSWLIPGFAGFLAAFVGALISSTFKFDNSNLSNQFFSWTVLIVVIVLFIVIIRYGLNSGGALAVAFAGAVVVAVAFAVAVARGFVVAQTVGIVFAFAFAFAFAVAFVGVVGVTFAVAAAGAVAFAFVTPFVGAVAGVFVVAVAVVGAFALTGAEVASVAGIGASVLAGAGALLSIYMSMQALKGDKKYAFILNIAIAFAAFGGTSFRNADLTDANFTQASLKSTDFRKATLTRTCFGQVKNLDRVRPGVTYLQYANLRQVLITGQGQEKNFDRFDLRGVNLQGAYLIDASFIAADISNACFQDTDLSRAKLVQTQLGGTDFTGAILTGAYIEDWNITINTNFTGVRCKYVYMRQPSKDNPDPCRKPDNREEVFKDGDFADFIQPIFDTLDLYHNQGVDPRAIAISFKQLAENHPDAELEIVAMEKRGDDKFLLRAKTTLEADKSLLSAEYFDTYNQIKSLSPEEQIKYYLTELKIKDNQIEYQHNEISRYENMINTALGRPSIQAETYNNQGNTMSQSPKKQSTFNMQGAQIAGGLVDAEIVNAHQIGGNITNYTTEQKQNLAQAAAEIQQLLTQLEQTNPTTTSAQKMAVVAKAVDEIEKNPTLKARVVGALKSGGVEALKEALDHPLVNVFIAAVDGWQDAN